MNLFELVAVLTLNKKGYDDGIASAEKSASGFGSKLKSGLGTAAKVGTAALATMGTAAVGVTKKIMSVSSATAELGDHIDKQSQKIGISAKAYQEWDFILTHNGASVDSLQASMKTLSKQALDCAGEFKDLGISEEYLQTASPEELFERVVKELQGMENSTQRTYIASKLLGKAGTELGPILNSTSDEIEAMRQQAHDLGKVMSDDAVKAGAAYEDSLYNLQTALTGVKNSLGSEFLPALVNVMDGLTGLFTGDEGAADKIASGVNQIVEGISKALPKILEMRTSLVESLGEAIVKAFPKIMETVTNALPQLVNDLIPLIDGLVDAIMSNIDPLLDAAIQIFTMMLDYVVENIDKIITGLVNIAMKIVDKIPQIIIPLIKAIPKLLSSIISAISANLPTIVKGLMGVMVQLAAELPDIIISIVDELPNLIQQLLAALLDCLPDIIDGLIKVVVGIVAKLPDIIMSLVRAIPQIIVMVIEALMQAIPQLVQGAIQLVVELVKHLPEIIMALIKAIPMILQQILEAFGPIGEMLGGLFGGVFDAITNIFGGLIDFFSGIFGAIGDVVGGVFEGIKNIAGGIVDAIKGFFEGAYNVVSGIFKTIKGWVSDVLEWLGIIDGEVGQVNKSVADVGYTVKVPGPKMAGGGILRKGEIGILEGNGAEAVVPLENNYGWIHAVAQDMQSAMFSSGGNQSMNVTGTITVKGVDKDGNNVDTYNYVMNQVSQKWRVK